MTGCTTLVRVGRELSPSASAPAVVLLQLRTQGLWHGFMLFTRLTFLSQQAAVSSP